jgi:hypothetical protein
MRMEFFICDSASIALRLSNVYLAKAKANDPAPNTSTARVIASIYATPPLCALWLLQPWFRTRLSLPIVFARYISLAKDPTVAAMRPKPTNIALIIFVSPFYTFYIITYVRHNINVVKICS